MEYWGNHAQPNACQSYWQGNPNSNFYNENPRNEPDFSWMSNDVRNPPYQPTYQTSNNHYHPPYQPNYQQPYQPTYHHPFHPTYHEPYQQPYQSPYQPPNIQTPNFQQPLPYNLPQPTNEIAELKALMKQLLDSQIALQEEMNASAIQPAVSENCEEYSYTRPNSILPDRVEDPVLKNTPTLDRVKSYPVEFSLSQQNPITLDRAAHRVSDNQSNKIVLDRVRPYPVECPMLQPESVKLDRATCRASHTRSSNEKPDRVNAPESQNSENSNVKAITSKPEAKIVIRLPFPNRQRQARVEHQFDTTNTPSAIIDTLEATQNGEKPIRKQDDNVSEALICLDSRVDEVDKVDVRSAMVDVLEADSYETELTSGQGETVSEPGHASEVIEVRTSELQSDEIEVNYLDLKLSPSDLNIDMLHDNVDCFIIKNITLSEHHPLEKGQYFCIQGQEKPQSIMQVVAEEEVRTERDGTRRGIKRCWDPGGFFDEVRIIPWDRRRDFGNRFGGANGRGMQDDYDDPGDERVTMQFVH